MEKFNSVISAAKNAAREERRLAYFLKLSGRIYRTEQNLEEVVKEIASYAKSIAVLNFEFAAVSAEHPNYAEKKECVEKHVKDLEETIKHLNSTKESIEKEIADIKTTQQETVDGKVKMDYDMIMARANELITLRVVEDFKAGNYDEALA